MEDVYSIKVKTKPDRRNVYPSERRYSASTVSGLAWVHIALAATSFLLACLALVNPSSDIDNLGGSKQMTAEKNGQFNATDFDDFKAFNDSLCDDNQNLSESMANCTNKDVVKNDRFHILVLAPFLLTIFALGAGVAAILASTRWYIDRNIAWLFIMSVLSTIFALTALIMILTWLVASESDISDFYKDKIPFKDYFVIKNTDVIDRNGSHIIVKNFQSYDTSDSDFNDGNNSGMFTKRVLSINILIAAVLELLWSLLSVKISYKGMRNNYKDIEEPRGNRVTVVTKIKGNNAKNMPRNGKKASKSLMDPNSKIKRIFLAQNDNGFYLKNQSNKKQTETSSEFYKERMMNFLNRCASLEGMSVSNPEGTATDDLETTTNTINLNPIPEIINVNAEINPNTRRVMSKTSDVQEKNEMSPEKIGTPENTLGRMTPVSWGDTPEHTIYNQNTLNLDKIFNFKSAKNINIGDKNNEAIEGVSVLKTFKSDVQEQ